MVNVVKVIMSNSYRNEKLLATLADHQSTQQESCPLHQFYPSKIGIFYKNLGFEQENAPTKISLYILAHKSQLNLKTDIISTIPVSHPMCKKQGLLKKQLSGYINKGRKRIKHFIVVPMQIYHRMLISLIPNVSFVYFRIINSREIDPKPATSNITKNT